jgi:hypothetical protein
VAGRPSAGGRGRAGQQEALRSFPPEDHGPREIVDQILHLRRTYHLGPIRIVWYLERYHDIRVCDATVYRTLKRHGMNRLPNRVGRRAVHTHRYEKQVPGHHVQVDVKFLTLRGKHRQRIRRYQYTAIDDATRVRAWLRATALLLPLRLTRPIRNAKANSGRPSLTR